VHNFDEADYYCSGVFHLELIVKTLSILLMSMTEDIYYFK